MLSVNRYKGMVADHPTPKSTTLNVGFTLNSRDYKGAMVVVYAIHEASGQDITFCDKAYSLVTGGGKPGQGYPAIIIHETDSSVGEPSK